MALAQGTFPDDVQLIMNTLQRRRKPDRSVCGVSQFFGCFNDFIQVVQGFGDGTVSEKKDTQKNHAASPEHGGVLQGFEKAVQGLMGLPNEKTAKHPSQEKQQYQPPNHPEDTEYIPDQNLLGDLVMAFPAGRP